MPLPRPSEAPSIPLRCPIDGASADSVAAAPEPIAHQGSLFGPRDRWLHRWRVASRSTPGKRYTVAVDAAGAWGCSCFGWIYHRARCHHIQQVAGPVGSDEARSAPLAAAS
jgi:hypothetical protein